MKILSAEEIKKLNKDKAVKHALELLAELEKAKAKGELPTDVEELQKKILAQEKLIGELSDELAAKPAGSTPANIVNVDGTDYRIAIPKFKHLGVEKTAADLKADKDLCLSLIKRGSGVLKVIK